MTSSEHRAATQQIRILHYLPSDAHGGVEEHALSILVSMRDFGIRPILAAPDALVRNMSSQLVAFGVETVHVEPFSPFDLRALARFARIIRAARPDVVHCHMFAATLRAAPVARLMGVRAIVETCHGPEAWRFGKPLKDQFWIDRLLTAGFVDRYIAVSDAAASHLRERKGISPGKITVIHNGRDLAHFRPACAPERERARKELGLGDEQAILVMGRLHEQKGHAFLLQALRLIIPHRPRLVALLAGDGPLREELEGQAKAAGIAERVRFLGFRSDAQGLFAACDLVVLPSLYEGLPLVAVEALAAARPIVATGVDGTPEVVIDGKTGLLVPPADPAALARAIERILDDESLGLWLATNGRAWVEREFTLRTQMEKTVALYRDLAARKPRVSPTPDYDIARKGCAASGKVSESAE